MGLTGSHAAQCPYCWEPIVLELDLSAGEAPGAGAGGLFDIAPASRVYTEDCPVCCQPMLVALQVAPDGGYLVEVTRENE